MLRLYSGGMAGNLRYCFGSVILMFFIVLMFFLTVSCGSEKTTGCKNDGDCTASQTCSAGKCEDKSSGCKADTDCKKEEVCKDSKCIPKETTGCKADTDCKKEEVCKDSKCIPKPKRGCGDGCPTGEYCFKKDRCLKTPKPCTPKQSGTCDKGYWCEPINKTCRLICDKANGRTNNKTCGKGRSCLSTNPSYCESLPNFEKGVIQKGEACNQYIQKFCDGSSKLFCQRMKCATACDYGKGRTNNPDCPNGDCIEDILSPLSGVCYPKATQKLGEKCNSSTLRCMIGLNCDEVCAKACDKSKPQPSGCNQNELCSGRSVCTKKCDPAEAIVGNKACPSNKYCRADKKYPPGLCQFLPKKKQGPKKIGESCSLFSEKEYCDASKGWFCDYFQSKKCRQACDPSKGKDKNPKCKASQTCQVDTSNSHLGGVCTP